MRRWALVLSVCGLVHPPVQGWSDAVDRYLASLNNPAVRATLGVQEVRRSARIANRLDVTFERDVSSPQRAQVLQRIAREFHTVLVRDQLIPVAMVVERDLSGPLVNSLVVSVSGRSGLQQDLLPASRDPC